MIYSVMPIEQIFEGVDKLKAYEEITVNGILMQVEPINATEARLVRLISPNPQDYLNPDYAPGQTIRFVPQGAGGH